MGPRARRRVAYSPERTGKAVYLLQAQDVGRPLAERPDRLHRRGGGGQRRDDEHVVQRRVLADGAVVVEGLAAERRVEDDLDLRRS